MDKKNNRSVEKIVKEIRAFKERSRKRFAIDRIVIFGSAAKGRMGPHSDIDLILTSKRFEGKSFFKRSVGLYSLWKSEYPVDFICLTEKEFSDMRKRVSIVS